MINFISNKFQPSPPSIKAAACNLAQIDIAIVLRNYLKKVSLSFCLYIKQKTCLLIGWYS